MKKIIIKYKITKKNFYRRFYQIIADFITKKLENSDNKIDFDYWYVIGIQLDIIAQKKNIYLK